MPAPPPRNPVCCLISPCAGSGLCRGGPRCLGGGGVGGSGAPPSVKGRPLACLGGDTHRDTHVGGTRRGDGGGQVCKGHVWMGRGEMWGHTWGTWTPPGSPPQPPWAPPPPDTKPQVQTSSFIGAKPGRGGDGPWREADAGEGNRALRPPPKSHPPHLLLLCLNHSIDLRGGDLRKWGASAKWRWGAIRGGCVQCVGGGQCKVWGGGPQCQLWGSKDAGE